jgi:curved DNA-binding protein CbpA
VQPAIPAPPAPQRSLSPTQLVAASPVEQHRLALVDKASKLMNLNHFEMLEIPVGASIEEARAAYFRLAKVFHPDKLPPELETERDTCTLVFARLEAAHRTLTDASTRATYLTSLGPKPAPVRQKPIVEARACVHRGDFAGAVQACERATQAGVSGDGDLLALAAWARANLVSGDIEAGLAQELAALDRAIELAPLSADALYYRAKVNRQLGRRSKTTKRRCRSTRATSTPRARCASTTCESRRACRRSAPSRRPKASPPSASASRAKNAATRSKRRSPAG